ncbi:MAG: pantoate--beta-alanine ligase [Chloroflexi bacterium]|nr:pantoate--beta-alanine ligase [Chloroflexota bacterium]
MHVVETVAEARAAVRQAVRPLGLVPTMGYLHEGHLSLVRRAREESATLAATIFVNPTQFGPTEDYATYPRNLERDLGLLREAGVDLVFAPTVEEMYPPGYDTYVTIGSVAERLEGAARPGHFRGVATVVAKLFNLLQPDRAYFGQKDAQQVVVIRKLVADLNLTVEVVALPIVREPDGLALSSRNVYLSPPERQAALVLWHSLQTVEARFRAGERDAEQLRGAMRAVLAAEPLAEVDYVSVADAATLDELSRVDRPTLVSLAVRIGRTRLIDNFVLGVEG